jgi:uncharacterized integral membrane protein
MLNTPPMEIYSEFPRIIADATGTANAIIGKALILLLMLTFVVIYPKASIMKTTP